MIVLDVAVVPHGEHARTITLNNGTPEECRSGEDSDEGEEQRWNAAEEDNTQKNMQSAGKPPTEEAATRGIDIERGGQEAGEHTSAKAVLEDSRCDATREKHGTEKHTRKGCQRSTQEKYTCARKV
jgi:hypothetical protein